MEVGLESSFKTCSHIIITIALVWHDLYDCMRTRLYACAYFISVNQRFVVTTTTIETSLLVGSRRTLVAAIKTSPHLGQQPFRDMLVGPAWNVCQEVFFNVRFYTKCAVLN